MVGDEVLLLTAVSSSSLPLCLVLCLLISIEGLSGAVVAQDALLNQHTESTGYKALYLMVRSFL